MVQEANPYVSAAEIAQRLVSAGAPFIASVVSTTGGLVNIRRQGAQTVEGPYPAASGLAATLTGGELVLVVKAGSTLIVLAEIVTS